MDWDLEELEEIVSNHVSKLFKEIRNVGGTREIENMKAIMNKQCPDLTS